MTPTGDGPLGVNGTCLPSFGSASDWIERDSIIGMGN